MERHEAIVLNERTFRASDRVVTVLSPTAGKRELLARGTRKIVSKLGPSLQPFSRVRVAFIPGRRFTHLIGVETIDPFVNLRHHLAGFAQAGFVVDVAGALAVAHQDDARLYRLVVRELQRIDRIKKDVIDRASVLALSLFALRAIAVAGWHPDLRRCSVCRLALDGGAVVFFAHPFGFGHRRCAGETKAVAVQAATRRFLLGRFRRRVIPAIVTSRVAGEVGRIAAAALEGVLERPLRSRDFFRLIARGSAPGRAAAKPLY